MADRAGRRGRRQGRRPRPLRARRARAAIGVPQARVVETLGNPQDQRKISLIAVHAHGIPDEFPHAVLAEAADARAARCTAAPTCATSPLLTIDPVDARDHDDAVHAAPDADPRTPAASSCTSPSPTSPITCAPAPGSTARRSMRGNSVYFPDRVVPMLPERISNDLCSLRESEERPCLAVRMVFDKHGDKTRPHLPARHDALGRQALLPGGAGRHRRPAEREAGR